MICVVKLGGSLHRDRRLLEWLAMLSDQGRGRVVIVPGGGPYADAVRAEQAFWKFSDAHAHRLAVLAMEQFALQLHALNPRFTLAESRSEISNCLAENRAALWRPSAMVLSAGEIPTTWNTTSDSIAAWLANSLNADKLMLVKSCEIEDSMGLAEWANRNIIDHDFITTTHGARYSIHVLSVTQMERARTLITTAN